MEVVYYSPRHHPSLWHMKPIKKRRSLMQRLSSWFEDHLPLRRRSDVRRSERGSRRKASKSAAPRMRYSVSNAQKQNDLIDQLPLASSAGPHSMSVSMIGKHSIYDDGYTDHHRYQPYFDDMSVSTFSHLGPRHPPTFNEGPMSQSFSSAYSSCRRPRIRTNPWIQNNRTPSMRETSIFRSPQPASFASRSIYSAPDALSSSAKDPPVCKPPELLYSSMDRTAQLRVKSLDESTCSSGYGSQDSSPESSVHFPDWQQAAQLKRVEDKAVECSSLDVDTATLGLKHVHRPRPQMPQKHSTHSNYNQMLDDEHVYHELESLHRLSLLLEERAGSSEGEMISPQPTRDEKGDSRTSSPIYAVPYDSQRNSLCSENPLLPEFTSKLTMGSYENPYARVQPLSIESPFFQKPGNSRPSHYAVPGRRAPEWRAPPPPPLEKEGEVDFLAELDKQIAELQIQSDAVRQLVEQAKERQELRERTRILCMEHIIELKKMRWFMRNNFELCL